MFRIAYRDDAALGIYVERVSLISIDDIVSAKEKNYLQKAKNRLSTLMSN